MNDFLRSIVANEAGVPKRGEVGAIAGGPPCQGFSDMNTNKRGETSVNKNYLPATFVSLVDALRPDVFLLENVLSFATYADGSVLRAVVRSLLDFGYRVRYGGLAAGLYGVPQVRRRLVIQAFRPDAPAPTFPIPRYAFAKPGGEANVAPNGHRVRAAPETARYGVLERITVGDAIGDLGDVAYLEPTTDFQRRCRDAPGLTLHRSSTSEETSARAALVPKKRGADWRDIPNKRVKKADGSYLVPLEYGHPEIEGAPPKRSHGGVGHKRQAHTTIPWSLPHTSARKSNWNGLYGRVDVDGRFETTVTHPYPLGKQGTVLHYDRDRILTARECARSQSFPDGLVLMGDLNEVYRQIGNAVPFALAKEIGRAWRRAFPPIPCEPETVIERVARVDEPVVVEDDGDLDTADDEEGEDDE